MPEVAEVALTAEILSKYFKNKILTSIDFSSGRYTKKNPKGYETFVDYLPLKVTKIDSRGKFMWFTLSDDENEFYIFNTYGLTGMWSLYEPRFCRVTFNFSSGKNAYFSDMRNFGTFIFTDDRNELDNKLKKLGVDFLKDEDFDLVRIKKYDKPIVELLMSQGKIGSGIGNYLVAEILYRAKLSPWRKGSSLKNSDIVNLEYWIKYLTKLSYVKNSIGYMVNLEAESGKIKRKNYHPDIELEDEEFDFLVYGRKFDPDGNKVTADKIIKGRTTYWVKKIQK